jgi:hypothetical protein
MIVWQSLWIVTERLLRVNVSGRLLLRNLHSPQWFDPWAPATIDRGCCGRSGPLRGHVHTFIRREGSPKDGHCRAAHTPTSSQQQKGAWTARGCSQRPLTVRERELSGVNGNPKTISQRSTVGEFRTIVGDQRGRRCGNETERRRRWKLPDCGGAWPPQRTRRPAAVNTPGANEVATEGVLWNASTWDFLSVSGAVIEICFQLQMCCKLQQLTVFSFLQLGFFSVSNQIMLQFYMSYNIYTRGDAWLRTPWPATLKKLTDASRTEDIEHA